MKYYKDSNNEIFAYELDGSQDYLINGKTSISKEEADAIIYLKLDHLGLCKQKAKSLLGNSDWSVLSDVGLKNTADYIAYRAILRGYATTPVADPIWPIEPQPIWN